MAELIDNLVDLLNEDGESRHAVGQVMQRGVKPFLQYGQVTGSVLRVPFGLGAIIRRFNGLTLVKEVDEGIDGLQRPFDVEQLRLLKPCVLDAHAFQRLAHVEAVGQREVNVAIGDGPHLSDLGHPLVNLFGVVGESHLVDEALAEVGEALGLHHLPHLVKSQFVLYILWIQHAV